MGAYVFCLETVAGFLCDNLDEVRRTPVRCERTAVPESLLAAEPEERELVVASPRADALVAAVYRLSRSEAQALFVRGLVFVNARLLENGSRELNDGDIVSVRGYGRFVFGGMLRETKKGRIRASVLIY